MLSSFLPFLIALVAILIASLGLLVFFKICYVKVPQGSALIINDTGNEPKVSFTGALVLPVIHKAELMKLGLISLPVDRRGSEGLICKDNVRADITVTFYLRVNENPEDVLKAAKSIGVDRASDSTAVGALFKSKFAQAVMIAGKQFDLVELFQEGLKFREKVRELIGRELNGFVLEDVAVNYLEQASVKP